MNGEVEPTVPEPCHALRLVQALGNEVLPAIDYDSVVFFEVVDPRPERKVQARAGHLEKSRAIMLVKVVALAVYKKHTECVRA